MFTAEQMLRALYLGVLGREPDPEGLETFTALLHEDASRLNEVAATFHRSEEHFRSLTGASVILDHSQNGEFRLFLDHFLAMGARHKVIVDVGANGRERSNSFDLMKYFGWKGLLIEANPSLWPSIERDFAGLDYRLVRGGVAEQEGVMPLFLGIHDDISSLIRDSVVAFGEVRGEVAVAVRRLGDILADHDVPKNFDILSLDIEGLDISVLNDLLAATDYRPELISIETSMNFAYRSLDEIAVNEIAKQEYRLAFQTRANMILARK